MTKNKSKAETNTIEQKNLILNTKTVNWGRSVTKQLD